MKNIFRKIGIIIEDNPLPFILIALLFVVVSFQGMQMIEVSTGMDNFVDKDSKIYQEFDHLYQNIFGIQSIAVLIEGDEVKNPELLQAIDRLDYSTSSINGIMEISSISTVVKNINYEITGRERIPLSQKDVDSVISMAGSDIKKVLPDDTHTVMFIEMKEDLTDSRKKEILREVQTSIEMAGFPAGYSIKVTGQPAFDEAKENEVNSSTGPLLMLSAILMIFVLYLVFRNVRWRLFPLAVVLLGIVYTFGAMGFIGIPKSMISMAAFPILVGIGIDYIIQFHCRIEEELKHGESEEQAVIETIKHTGPAVLIALVITSLGFISLLTSPVPMIQDFGKLLLIGIFMCFIASLFVGVPVLYKLDSLGKMKIFARFRSQNDKRSDQRKKDNGPDILEKTIGNVTKLTINHPFLVLLIAGSLCIAGLYADQSVPVQTDNRKYVPQDMDALVDLNHLYDIIGGEDQINLIIKVDDNADPEVLKWVDEFSEHEVSSRSHIYSSDSIVSIVKSANGGMIPDSREEIIQIYEQMPETQKDRYVNGASMLHLSFNIGNAMDEMGLEGIGELTETIKEDISWMEAPPGISVTITGSSTVYVSVISALTSGRIQMTFLGLLLVLGGLLFIYRNPVKAFAPVITMFMVVGWTGGVMYYLGMEYTTLSATLGALILGVGSEYAILIMERYFEEKEKGAKPEEAMYEASVKIGKAIVTSGLTTLFGFSALIVSYFPITRNFGTVTVIDVGLALIATFIITPPVIVHLDKYSEKRKAKSMKTIKRQEMRTEISYKKEADF